MGLEMEVGHERWKKDENQIQVVEEKHNQKILMEMENL